MKSINAWDTEKGICIVEKKDGKRVCTYIDHIQWYFYMKSKDIEDNMYMIKTYQRQGLLIKREQVGEYSKVYARKERGDCKIETFREECYMKNIPLYEFDLSKAKRYCIDNNIEIEDELRVLYFDIETDDRIGNIEIGRDEILSWSAVDQEGKTYQKAGDEEKILRSFVRTIEKYDVIAGWNSEEFDLPYIQMRCEKYGIKYNWRTIIHLDMLQRAHKLYSYDATHIGLANFKLNTFAKFFLDQTKTELEGKKIHELYKEDLKLLLEYNLNDAILLKNLDEKLKIISLMVAECKLTYSHLNKFYVGELLDNYILRKAKSKGVILHSKASKVELEDMRTVEIAGGYVKTPLKGYYEKVHICDFKSLYPSIIVGWNIGVDVLDLDLSRQGNEALMDFLHDGKIEEKEYVEWDEFLKAEKKRLDPENKFIQTANNAFFRKDQDSFIAQIVQDFLNMRAEYKKKLKILDLDTAEYNTTYANERVFKELANSMFGITCEKASRYFNKLSSEGITMTGQYLNKKSAYIAEQQGLKVIYGDTDSIFIVGTNEFDEVIDTINKVLNTTLNEDFGLLHNIVYLEYEKRFKKFILLEKKKYSGLLEMKDDKLVDKLFSRGTTDVQKSNTTFGRQTYLEVVELVFKDGVKLEELIDYIKLIQRMLYEGAISPDKLVKHIRISKNVDDYKVDSVNKRLVKRLLDEQKILPIVLSTKKIGTRLDYVIIDQNGRHEAVLLDELKGNVDYDYYWIKEIYAPIKRVMKVVYPQVDWDIYESQRQHPTLF
jgi:DNA polymerase elongation subunit (family B)